MRTRGPDRGSWLVRSPVSYRPALTGRAFGQFTPEHGILSFRLDDETETLIIFNILWIG